MRAAIATTTGESSTILSNVKSGLPKEQGIDDLRALSDSIDAAEQAIKLAGIYNLQFRFNQEYVVTMGEIRDARQNIRERVLGIISLAETGRTELTPEELMFEAGQL